MLIGTTHLLVLLLLSIVQQPSDALHILRSPRSVANHPFSNIRGFSTGIISRKLASRHALPRKGQQNAGRGNGEDAPLNPTICIIPHMRVQVPSSKNDRTPLYVCVGKDSFPIISYSISIPSTFLFVFSFLRQRNVTIFFYAEQKELPNSFDEIADLS